MTEVTSLALQKVGKGMVEKICRLQKSRRHARVATESVKQYLL